MVRKKRRNPEPQRIATIATSGDSAHIDLFDLLLLRFQILIVSALLQTGSVAESIFSILSAVCCCDPSERETLPRSLFGEFASW